ncbi:MAG TPA: DEAD/DEAH box helicase [Chloroflexota bacterium]|nr:DEAD/DEAH box helicase [Chloroflexota bacterium]
MNVAQFVDRFLRSPSSRACVTSVRHLAAQPARWADFPPGIDARLAAALASHGVQRLYTHQAEAIGRTMSGENVVTTTPTASGKTLCYNVPVLQSILGDPSARALYLFPTKALAQDQLRELSGLVDTLDVDIKAYTYDGDTPADARRAVRAAGHMVVTNPDMLHTGILPHHTRWVRLFENLRYIVIDELHQYRGVFGSHLGNVLRRLQRICEFYGASPKFICSSATIANPDELAARLTGQPFRLVSESGAPTSEKFILFYNPPVVNQQLGIRAGSSQTSRKLAGELLANDIQTIVFARSRLGVEILVTELKQLAASRGKSPDLVQGYRAGYLPNERRAIERGIKDGRIRSIVATNALELGVDIGGLDAAVLNGYPGSIASAWQQMGRVGRREGTSLAIYVATSSPLDQFLVTRPDYFFSQSPEAALVHPDNLVILANHLRCAAFELPFEEREQFGESESTTEILQFLADEHIVRHAGGRWFWMSERYPAEGLSLRSAAIDNFVIIESGPRPRVIGEVDRASAPMLIHEEAIYIHLGQQYQVERLDWEEKKAYVKAVNVDYYTDAETAVDLKVLDVFAETEDESPRAAHGEVSVTAQATIFKKLKFETHENIGWGKIQLPEEEIHTSAFWLTISSRDVGDMAKPSLESGLMGLANLLVNLAPLFLMCDPRDLRSETEIRSPFTGGPTVFLYERNPGGVGLSEKLFYTRNELIRSAQELLTGCACPNGCPSCVGAHHLVGFEGKASTLELFRRVGVHAAERALA